MDSLMNTEPDSRMYQQVPMSSGLENKREQDEMIIAATKNKYNQAQYPCY